MNQEITTVMVHLWQALFIGQFSSLRWRSPAACPRGAGGLLILVALSTVMSPLSWRRPHGGPRTANGTPLVRILAIPRQTAG